MCLLSLVIRMKSFTRSHVVLVLCFLILYHFEWKQNWNMQYFINTGNRGWVNMDTQYITSIVWLCVCITTVVVWWLVGLTHNKKDIAWGTEIFRSNENFCDITLRTILHLLTYKVRVFFFLKLFEFNTIRKTVMQYYHNLF